MALKAGRVGVAPSQVDEFGIIQGGGPSGDAYTKEESDAKFLAKTDAASTYATKAQVAGLMAEDIAYDGTDSGLTATDTQAAIDEVNDKVDDYCNYSTNEQVIGKWVDGKTLYRKVIKGTTSALPNEYKQIGTIGTFNEVTNITGSSVASDGACFGINMFRYYETHTQVQSLLATVSSSGNVSVFWSGANDYRKEVPVTVIVEYTKTTD